jgi:hypothetical protein
LDRHDRQFAAGVAARRRSGEVWETFAPQLGRRPCRDEPAACFDRRELQAREETEPTSASSGTVSRMSNRLAMVMSKSQVDELDGRPTLACGEEASLPER